MVSRSSVFPLIRQPGSFRAGFLPLGWLPAVPIAKEALGHWFIKGLEFRKEPSDAREELRVSSSRAR